MPSSSTSGLAPAGEVGAAVVHGHQDAFQQHVRVGSGLPDLLDDLDNFCQPLKAEPLALQRDQDLVGSRERRGHQHAERQRRRGVEDTEIKAVVLLGLGQQPAQAHEVVVHPCQLDFDSGEVHAGGDQGEVSDP